MQVEASFLNEYSTRNRVLKIAAAAKTTMGGGKTTRGKKILREETATSSTRSVQTPFRGQEEASRGGIGGVDGGVVGGEVANSGMQIPKSGICNPSICEESESVSVDERVASHKSATTSWRCGFGWVAAHLRSRLRAWDVEQAEEEERTIEAIYTEPFAEMTVHVLPHTVPHIIGRGGRVIRQIELVCGVFLTLRDLPNGNHELFMTGPRPACILAQFAIEMLGDGHYSVLRTLSSLTL